MTVEVNFGTSSSSFRFLNTLGFSSEIHFFSLFVSMSPFLRPPLVKTCFERSIPEKLEISPFLCRGYRIAKSNNIFEVGDVDKRVEIK